MSRSVPEIHSHVAGTLSNQPTTTTSPFWTGDADADDGDNDNVDAVPTAEASRRQYALTTVEFDCIDDNDESDYDAHDTCSLSIR